MNTIEQQLWDYIDGNLNDDQIKNIRKKIESDHSVQLQYEELLKLNAAFSEMELDEPSMSFTRNVMEDVAILPAPVALKTKVDQRIIYSIAGFFGLALVVVFGYILYNSTFSFKEIDFNFKIDLKFNQFLDSTGIYIFLFADLIIGLVFLDYIIRKKTADKAS
ncbi:hypothetical protein [Pedobacter punctiformis]|uniref:Zinc-finger domain-containing protein n=1 Tax=Pedobacter punctiformis TaxID=3004097 RepID=A0ABT4L5B7_9SPHI|nr:hypothetical protein [Pedobacter sp. HCMS5-2]MCZ4243115.1 hypothetical protein [Pedobacter sp. HCMS5-2]